MLDDLLELDHSEISQIQERLHIQFIGPNLVPKSIILLFLLFVLSDLLVLDIRKLVNKLLV